MDEIVEASVKRMRRNRFIWDLMLLEAEAEEKEVEKKRKISVFRPRRVFQRESYRKVSGSTSCSEI